MAISEVIRDGGNVRSRADGHCIHRLQIWIHNEGIFMFPCRWGREGGWLKWRWRLESEGLPEIRPRQSRPHASYSSPVRLSLFFFCFFSLFYASSSWQYEQLAAKIPYPRMEAVMRKRREKTTPINPTSFVQCVELLLGAQTYNKHLRHTIEEEGEGALIFATPKGLALANSPEVKVSMIMGTLIPTVTVR